jgi:Domain of unknown function (DUF4224)
MRASKHRRSSVLDRSNQTTQVTSMSTGFLSELELIKLTGRRMKSRQIAWLRVQGIAFRINATGHPVVTWATVEGRQEQLPAQNAPTWEPRAA